MLVSLVELRSFVRIISVSYRVRPITAGEILSIVEV